MIPNLLSAGAFTLEVPPLTLAPATHTPIFFPRTIAQSFFSFHSLLEGGGEEAVPTNKNQFPFKNGDIFHQQFDFSYK